MSVVARVAILGIVAGAAASCTAPSHAPATGFAAHSGAAIPAGLTCPVMTRVEYDHLRPRTMLGASADNPLICSTTSAQGFPQSLVLNWYAVDRLRSSDLDHAVDVLTSLVTGPVGFTTSWNRFLGSSSAPYETQFVVAPDQSITIGGKPYDVHVVKATSRVENNEYWFDKNSLTILKYVDGNIASRSYTVTALVELPRT